MIKLSSSLKKRLLTASILAPVVLAITYSAPSNVFAIFLSVFLVLSAYEWANLSGVSNNFIKSVYIFLLLVVFIYLHRFYHFEDLQWLFHCSGLWWLYILCLLRFYKGNQKPAYIKLLQGLITIVPAVLAMFFIHQQYGAMMIFYLFAVVWGADIGAYFSGKQFGKHKLAPSLSPGKTIEGVAGGLLFVMLLSIVVAVAVYESASNIITFVVISIIVAGFSVVGDLYESLLKREAGVKDSSRLLPGHGGVLDRIDSLFAAAPLFFLFYISFLV